ncbi:mCG1046001, partial [Mus musculus]
YLIFHYLKQCLNQIFNYIMPFLQVLHIVSHFLPNFKVFVNKDTKIQLKTNPSKSGKHIQNKQSENPK